MIDVTGQKFGRWSVIEETLSKRYPNGTVHRRYICECECGIKRIVLGPSLTNGVSKSCGCLQREITIKRSYKHGHSSREKHTPTYIVWKCIIQRCENPRNKNFPEYGARGIKMCPRWRESYANFLSDMGERPVGMTIERDNVNGNYEPGNCRWATHTEQMNNTRRNVRVWDGEKYITMSEAATTSGLTYDTFKRLYRVRGLSLEQITNGLN